MEPLRLLRSTFLERLDVGPVTALLAYRLGRFPLSVGLALLPPLVLVAAVWIGPAEVGKAATGTTNVHDVFARFISAIATASAIAVSVATLSLRREMKGVHRLEERHDANDAYRERVRRGAGVPTGPLGLGRFLAVALRRARDEAREAEREAGAAATRAVEGVTLAEFLQAVQETAERRAQRLDAAGPHPFRIASNALDFEEEMTTHLLRGYLRMDDLPAGLHARLQALEEAVDDVLLGAAYAKTLDTQWGFSRMSMAIATTALPALATATLMVLMYGQGAVDALGVLGAAVLVAAALAVALLPITCFVSYVLRFVFMNAHTLPTDSFLLGPESPAAVRRESRRGRGVA